MKIKMVEQVIEVPDNVGEVMLRDQEILPDSFMQQQIKTAEGWSYQAKFPLRYELVEE
ncbi:MAG TPA: hypothetical protein V6C72_10305 [Chroococcales cyanobacterium]